MSVVKEHTVCRQTSECLGISFSGAREVRHPQLGLLLVFLLVLLPDPESASFRLCPFSWILRVPGGAPVDHGSPKLSAECESPGNLCFCDFISWPFKWLCCMFRNKFVLICTIKIVVLSLLKQVNLYKNYRNLLSLKHPWYQLSSLKNISHSVRPL